MVFSLASEIELGIKILVIISGLLLFFLYRKSLKKFKLYFSVYPLAVLFIVIGLIFRGIIAGLILSIILFPIIPNEKEFEAEGVIITTPFQGFMAACCSYQIKERQLLIFEKDYGIFQLEGEGPIVFETMSIEKSETEISLRYSTSFEKEIVKGKILKR